MFKKITNQFFSRPSRNRKRTSSYNTTKLDFESLESRQLMAVAANWFEGSKLIVSADNANTRVEVVQVGSNLQIKDLSTAATRTWNYVRSAISTVEFRGGAGNDSFINNISNLPVRAFGGAGNDYLEGFNGNDYLVGGDGNDTLKGFGGNDNMIGGNGNDRMFGGSGDDGLDGGNGNDHIEGGSGNDVAWGMAGNDTLLGGDGNDQLAAGTGNDHLNGQAGVDKLWGESGTDVLIAIDAAFGEYVDGGADADIMWIDAVGSSRDSVVAPESFDKVQSVASFANGADRSLNGDRIADPMTKSGHVYKRFDSNPLFSSDGPRMTDVRQGDLSNCYFHAGLGAIALDSPFALRQNMVDFNDGTYGVRMGASFYRVDNDLAVVTVSATAPAYAKLGFQNSMWVAIAEKVFAMHRRGQNSYASTEWGWSVEVNRAFGSTTAGARNINSYSNSTALANDIASRWVGRQAVTVGFSGAVVGSAPLIGSHMYTVSSIIRNSAGVITGIQLRNPWGIDGRGNDGNNDGFVTVTPAQLFAQVGQVNFGRV